METVPHYINDMEVYVWEPFKQRPRLDFVRMLVLPQTHLDQRRSVLVASTPTLLRRLAEEPVRITRTTSLTPGVEAQMFRFFSSVYRMIRQDTVDFLVQASMRTEQINLGSRSHPSAWKMQLLSHLQECYLDIARECDRNLETLKSLISRISLPCTAADISLCHYLAELEEFRFDIQCLAAQLRLQAEAITPVKKLVREQMELVTNYRNTIIAVLVALYVPISFVSVSSDGPMLLADADL